MGNRTYRGDDPHRGTEQEGKAFGGGWLERLSVGHVPQATNLWYRVAG